MKISELKLDLPVIAHRGASAYAPENTLAAFKKAKEQGATWIEFDVMLAHDGEVLVFHDETLERTTNGSGKLNDHSYEYLKTLDAGSWFHARFSGEKIPSLKEALLFLKAHALRANIELKTLPGKEKELAQKVLSLTTQYWPDNLPPLLFSSFSMETMRELRKASAVCLLGLIVDDLSLDWKKNMQALHCSAIHVDQTLINAEALKKLKSVLKPVFCYTVNDPLRALELISAGVDAVFTDCPDTILQILKK